MAGSQYQSPISLPSHLGSASTREYKHFVGTKPSAGGNERYLTNCQRRIGFQLLTKRGWAENGDCHDDSSGGAQHLDKMFEMKSRIDELKEERTVECSN